MNRFLLPAILPVILGASLAICAPSTMAEDITTLIAQKQASGDTGPLSPTDIPYTYVITADISSGEGDDAESYIAKYQVNPKAAPGSRLTFIGEPLETFPKDFQRQMASFENEATEAEMAEEFWCADDEEDADQPDMSPENFTVIRDDADEAVIGIDHEILKDMMKTDSGDGDNDMPKKILKRLTAELTLSKPDLQLRNMKVWLTKPTTIKIVAKIKEMNIEQSCGLAPNGIPYVTTRKMRVSGKALGSKFMENAVITVSDLQPL